MKRATLISLGLLAAAAIGAAAWLSTPSNGFAAYRSGAALEARLYGFDTINVDIGEMRIAAYDSGAAPGRDTLVLLHGYSADRQVWPRFARHLLDQYRVIIPDLAGHGDTGFDPAWDYSAPAQARRVAALLDRLGIERAHIAGNSMGGFITAHFALAYPQRSLSATLIDPAGVESPKASDADSERAAGRNPFLIHDRAEFDAFYAMTMQQPPLMPGFMLAGIAEQYQQHRDALATIFSGFYQHDMLDAQLAQITVPTLLIWGSGDRIIDISAAQVWQQGVPKAELSVFDGIGHMPMVEVPKATAERVRAFLSALPQT